MFYIEIYFPFATVVDLYEHHGMLLKQTKLTRKKFVFFSERERERERERE